MSRGPILQCAHGVVGAAPPGIGLEEHGPIERHLRPALTRRTRTQAFARRPARCERGLDLLDRADVAVVEPARRVEERYPGVFFELAPQRERALRERDVVGLGVREAEDARPAVAAAAHVALIELLEEHDVDATPREPPRGRRAHRARSDHDDVTPHQPTSVADLSRRASTPSIRTAASAQTTPDAPMIAHRAIEVRASVPAVRKWRVASPHSGNAST